MASKNEENWMMHYNELKAYVAVHHHFPDKHKVEFRGLLNWAKDTNGRHVGWAENGVYYDCNNDVIGFTQDHTGHFIVSNDEF